jgi:stringent starvation protein B
MLEKNGMTTRLKEREEKVKKIKKLLLDQHILVHLKPNFPGVDLPEHLRELPVVTLKLSSLFRGSLEVQDEKVVTELLFNSEYYRCEIPIDAIGAVTSVGGETFAWTEPSDVEDSDRKAVQGPTRRRPQKVPRAAAAPQPAAEETTPSKRPVLRRIK